MAGTALVLVHGRSQQMPAAARRGRAEEVAFVAKKRQTWLAGLAKGLTLAGLPPIDTSAVYFPYYGNRFADAIAARERRGLPRPDLESGFEDGDDVVVERPPSADALILDSALLLGFTPGAGGAARRRRRGSRRSSTRRGSPTPRAASAPTSARSCGRGCSAPRCSTWPARPAPASSSSSVPHRRRLLPRRPADPDLVVDIVAGEIRRAAASHDKVVLVTHSLGTVVAYDVFDDLNGTVDVPLFVTAGCPLGLPAVQRNLLPAWTPAGKRPGPELKGAPVPWLNAFDVRDFVALVHPLANLYSGSLRRGADPQRRRPARDPGLPRRPRRGPPDRPGAGGQEALVSGCRRFRRHR